MGLERLGTLGELLAKASGEGRWWVLPLALVLALALLGALAWQASAVVLPVTYR